MLDGACQKQRTKKDIETSGLYSAADADCSDDADCDADQGGMKVELERASHHLRECHCLVPMTELLLRKFFKDFD